MSASKFAKVPFNPAKWPFFYGWFVIFLGTIGILMSIPGQTIGVSTFTDSLIDVLRISRDDLSLAYMIGTITSSLLLTKAGKAYDKHGVRIVAVMASIFLAIVLIYLSQVDKIVNIFASPGDKLYNYVAFGFVLIGFAALRFSGQGVLTLASRTMMMKWFDQRRGFATGFSNVFLALGFSSSPFVFEHFIQNEGWRQTWLLAAFILGIAFPLVILIFFRNAPQDVGLMPDGGVIGKSKPKKLNFVTKKDFTLQEARRTNTFWLYAFFLAWQGMYITGLTFHIVSIFEVNGMDRIMAISIFQPSAVIAVIITLAVSWASDFMRLKYLLYLKSLGAILASTGLIFLGNGDLPYYFIIVGNGLLMGLFGVLSTVCWPRFFGKQHLGAISGQAMTIVVFGSALGPYLFSTSLSLNGTYDIAGYCCLSIAVVLFLGATRSINPQDKIV